MEQLKKDAQDLKTELFEQTSIIEGTICELEKALAILDHWIQEYSFYENPDPMAAIASGATLSRNHHQAQSAIWFADYKKIFQFINIATDYVLVSREKLQAALQK